MNEYCNNGISKTISYTFYYLHIISYTYTYSYDTFLDYLNIISYNHYTFHFMALLLNAITL